MAYTHVRITMKFAEANGNTESESLYYAYSSLGTLTPTRTGPVAVADLLVAKRSACLVKSWQILSVTISPAPIPKTETSPRISLNFPAINGQGKRSNAPDVPAVTIACTLRSAAQHRRTMLLHGFPDDSAQFDPNTGAETTTGIGASLQAYLDFLKTPPAAYLKVQLTPARSGVSIQGIAVAVNGTVTFTAPGLGGGIVAGDKFQVSSCKGSKANQFNGLWNVATYDNVTGALVTSSSRRIDPNFFYEQGSGKIRMQTGANVGFDNITDYDATTYATTRKTANPFIKRRGRRSARR